MKSCLRTAAIAMTIAAGSAFADQPSFNYLEGGYSLHDFADGNEADGFTLRGSVEINDNFYVVGKGTKTSSDAGFFDVDDTRINAGAGFKLPVMDNASFYTQLSYSYVDLDIDFSGSSTSFSDDGFELEGGVRAMLGENTELSTNIKHTSFDSAVTTVGVGLRQYLGESFGVFAEASRNDFDNNSYDLGVSFRF